MSSRSTAAAEHEPRSQQPAPQSVTQSVAQTHTHRVRVWDAPLRAFHWLLLVSVTSAITTGLLGGDWMVWHGRAGLAIVGLLAFRLAWGVVGSETSRFAQFVPSPSALLAYLRGHWHGIGHNPLGALSVLALLGLLAAQAGTGLFSNDDIAFAGPLSSRVDEDLVHQLTGWHHRLVNGLYALIALHLLAIVFHTVVKRVRLVPAMVTGWQDVPRSQLGSRPAQKGAFALALGIALLLGYGANGHWPASGPATGSATSAISPVAAASEQSPAAPANDQATQPASAGASASTPAW